MPPLEDKPQAADRTLREWKNGIARPAYRVEILRGAYGRRPKLIAVLDDLPDEETLMESFGGGHYRVVVKRPDSRGRFVYAATATFDVAGDPRPASVHRDEAEDVRVELLVRTAVERLERRVAELERLVRRRER
jgi:hypothetical protein